MICSSTNKFNAWYYADPFCGSGLFSFKDKDLKDEVYPGSALIGTIVASKSDYTDCLLSDYEKNHIDILNLRLSASKSKTNGRLFSANQMDFSQAVDNILSKKKFGTAILVFIDPEGYSPIKWSLMERLATQVGIDIIFNFMTYTIALNASASKKNKTNEKNLNEFFGDDEWQQFINMRNKQKLGSKLLEYYSSKIQRISGKNVIQMGVYKEKKKKLYDLLVITRSNAGTRVIKNAKDLMDNATTEAIKSEFKVQLKKQHTLTEY